MTGYFGSKAAAGLYQNIIAMMPPRNSIAIDIDSEALQSFDCGYPVQKVNACAHRYLRDYDYAGSELIYCDPPLPDRDADLETPLPP